MTTRLPGFRPALDWTLLRGQFVGNLKGLSRPSPASTRLWTSPIRRPGPTSSPPPPATVGGRVGRPGTQSRCALDRGGPTVRSKVATCGAKVAQEKVITESGSPYSIVRATQFFESVDGIADSLTEADAVRAPHGAFQPIAAADVASPSPARRPVIRPTE